MKTPPNNRRNSTISHGNPSKPGLAMAVLLFGASLAWASLEDYDAAILNDSTAGLSPVAMLGSAVTLTGTGGAAFDFGASSGDVTMEFILEGNPSANNSAFLAVGSQTASSLRYEVWDNTGELGFTQAGVADYQFSPGVPSPVKAAHIAYVWDPATTTMKLYVNGVLAGTTTGVSAAFAMPTGAGWLGSASDGSEAMVGTIHRVTVYDTALTVAKIESHANAYGAVVNQALVAYDAVITADETGGLATVSKLTAQVSLTGAGGAPFDFGASSGDVSMEFILEGDPSANNSAFLAVGANNTSSLRYEVWDNTGELGFTQIRVADYQFSPGVPSPTVPTHLTYVWDSAALTMKLYLNGKLAGTWTGVDSAFGMPTGAGWLGSEGAGGTEQMHGRIYRVTTYDNILSDTAILRHANAFIDVLRPPLIVSYTVSTNQISAGASAVLSWDVQNAKTILINGVDRTTTNQMIINPEVSTTYKLTAINSFGTVSSSLRVVVLPPLAAYDAAITADAATLVPLARLVDPLLLTGAGGAQFNFGTGSGDMSMEFILEGDTSANAGSYLAVGDNPTNSLRFELWNNTAHLGFTRLVVADYEFTPPVPSPSWPTHVVYTWDAANLTMKIYINGTLAGSTTGVDSTFAMPSGQGWLGVNPTGGEPMVGTIFRVTVYDENLAEAAIVRHANAFFSSARPSLYAYDSAIRQSLASGLTPVSRLLAPLTVVGAGGVGFNFGASSGDASMEFIVEGDPGPTVSANLAAGENTASMLRYEMWENTAALGFTLSGVADYYFEPPVPSPTTPTHLVYVWNAGSLSLKLYVNGQLARTVTGVDANFALPMNLGRLGANTDNTEPMVGTIHRVTAYDDVLADAVILSHAQAFLVGGQKPKLALTIAGTTPTITLTQGVSGGHYRIEYLTSITAGSWQLLQDIPSLNGTSTVVTDPTPVGTGVQRYYRAVQLP